MKTLIFLLIFPSIIFSKTYSPKELIDLGVKNTPQMKIQIQAMKISEAQLEQSRLVGNPMITYQGGSLKSATQAGQVTDLTISQPLPWPGKRSSRIKAQEFFSHLTQLDQEEMRLQISHRIYLVSSEISAIQELEKHYAERKRRFSLIELSFKSRPMASPSEQVEKDLIDSQIAFMEKGMIDLIARKEGLLWELNLLTGTKVEAIDFDWEKLPIALGREEYLLRLDESPKSKRWKLERSVSENKIEQAKLEARPDIVVGVNYRQENVAPVNHFYHGQISIVLPLIDRGQYTEQAARAEHLKTEALQKVERNQYQSGIYQSFAELEAARNVMRVFPLKNVRQMESKYLRAEKSFRKGLIEASTFLQVDTQIHENIDQIFFSRFSYVSALSRINLLIGKEPEL